MKNKLCLLNTILLILIGGYLWIKLNHLDQVLIFMSNKITGLYLPGVPHKALETKIESLARYIDTKLTTDPKISYADFVNIDKKES